MAYAPFDLTGKVALITGGNRGIGLGMAQALGQAGADIAIWGRDPQKNAEAETALKAHGRRVLALAVDVADEAQVVAAMARTARSAASVRRVTSSTARPPATSAPATATARVSSVKVSTGITGVASMMRATSAASGLSS